MPTLENPALEPIETGMRRLAPSLLRTVAETAEAFFAGRADLEPAWDGSGLRDNAALNCSQMNIGEGFELLCCLTTDIGGFDRLFPADVPEPIKMDAYCELANCICGAILADEGFADRFGYMTPCVPCLRPGRIRPGSRALRGALRMKGARIHFSLALRPLD
ncbi:MAG: hypothetical protein ABI036_18575 [Fibrobacteria bacterium]